MSATSRTTVGLRIVGHRPPGLAWSCYQGVHVGVQRRPGEVVGLVSGDADEAVFDLAMDVVRDDQGIDFRGPFVQGRRGERFLYLSWGEVGPGGGFEMFRRAKLHLAPLAEPETAGSLGPGTRVEASLELTDARGGPVCAAVRPPRIHWRVTSTAGDSAPAASTEGGAIPRTD
jgi:hypothetical protein